MWNKTGERSNDQIFVPYLLGHEVQSALQSVGHLDLPVSVIELNTSGPARRRMLNKTPQIKKLLRFQEWALVSLSNVMLLTRHWKGSYPGQCGPPGCSSQLLYIWECSSGWTPGGNNVVVTNLHAPYTSYLWNTVSQQRPEQNRLFLLFYSHVPAVCPVYGSEWSLWAPGAGKTPEKETVNKC